MIKDDQLAFYTVFTLTLYLTRYSTMSICTWYVLQHDLINYQKLRHQTRPNSPWNNMTVGLFTLKTSSLSALQNDAIGGLSKYTFTVYLHKDGIIKDDGRDH